MPLHIVENDITLMKVDAIVNAANETLLGGSGVDGAIHRAAGPALLEECRALGGCKTGQAKLTKGYRLPANYVIHTVGPVWRGGGRGERELLASAYRTSLELALAQGCKSVAFPLISAGVYGYPKDQALDVAVDTIGDFLLSQDMTVYLVIFHRTANILAGRLFADIDACIGDHFVEATHAVPRAPAPGTPDESFSQMLVRKIGEAGLTDVQCCKRANIDRRLLSEIRSDDHYKPSKPTAMAFAAALELPLEEAEEMLQKAGFALSHASKSDIIFEYFIARRSYNVLDINKALFAFGQSPLGG